MILKYLIIIFNFFFRDRLIANDFIQMHKVAEHVYEKVLGSDTGSVAVSPGVEDQDNGSFAEEKVELLCNEQVGNKLMN